eukprot:scaffold14339_cov107-Isochrysis_galbana.AAC.2
MQAPKRKAGPVALTRQGRQETRLARRMRARSQVKYDDRCRDSRRQEQGGLQAVRPRGPHGIAEQECRMGLRGGGGDAGYGRDRAMSARLARRGLRWQGGWGGWMKGWSGCVRQSPVRRQPVSHRQQPSQRASFIRVTANHQSNAPRSNQEPGWLGRSELTREGRRTLDGGEGGSGQVTYKLYLILLAR